ncbi:necrosis inducing protein [Triangularia verruculosa]|uniref:Necrosis inducing protein n=1 Tax=Triangularia verruculosa TaxID=2587418 RepID=A0AAN7AUW5_9PEZI|nr:necrosis inducing protein [Triangularia verruculosa]
MKLLLPTLLLGALTAVTADLLNPLSTNADQRAIELQPWVDADKDACDPTAAIDRDGVTLNSGLTPFGPGNCRSGRLARSQTYVRTRCNHYWCAYLYGYYFEKDEGFLGGSHRHDWEHIIVWTLHNDIFHVSWSAHGNYTTAEKKDVIFEGTHPKFVSHRAWTTHSWRRAEKKDEPPENETGRWSQAPLIALEKMPCEFNRKLLNNNWGSAHPDLKRDRFGGALDKAMPHGARYNEKFDPYSDS